MNIRNKKLHLDYEVLETYAAGMELLGFEVKALREGHAQIDGARVIVRGGEVYVVGMNIQPYQTANTPKSYQNDRTRKLLLKKSEIIKLSTIAKQGLSLLPLSIYDKNHKIKMDIVLVRRLKKWDKREKLKLDFYHKSI